MVYHIVTDTSDVNDTIALEDPRSIEEVAQDWSAARMDPASLVKIGAVVFAPEHIICISPERTP